MKDRNEFYRLAIKAVAGCQQYEADLALTRCTAAMLAPLLLTAQTQCAAFDASRGGKQAAFTTLHNQRIPTDDFVKRTRDYLSGILGSVWKPVWAQVGWTNNTLALPERDSDRLRVLGGIKNYFTTNPAHENAATFLTAAQADTLKTALGAAMTTVTDCKRDSRTKRDDRDTAESALEEKLAVLRAELDLALDPLDPRWLEFIDRIPGDPRVPEPVAQVSATVQPGVIALDWPDAARATRYRVLKLVGAAANWEVADTVEESQAQLTGIPAGTTVKLQIVPLNGVGEGAASAVVQLQAA